MITEERKKELGQEFGLLYWECDEKAMLWAIMDRLSDMAAGMKPWMRDAVARSVATSLPGNS